MAKNISFKNSFLVSTVLLTIGLLAIGCLTEFAPEPPVRSVQEMNGVSLLWVEEMEITNPYRGEIEFFAPDNQSIVFWSPDSDSLVALNVTNGATLWQTKAPRPVIIRLYRDKFFLITFEWGNLLEYAPNTHLPKPPECAFCTVVPSFNEDSTTNEPELGDNLSDSLVKEEVDCSFGGTASLLAYDAYTGQQNWGYVYYGVSYSDIFFADQSVYLTGSGDHGASQSIAKIDVDSGALLQLDCNKWPEEKTIPSPLMNNEYIASPYHVVTGKDDLQLKGIWLFFETDDHWLHILDGNTKETIGSIYFEGAKLSPWEIYVTVQSSTAIIYLENSNQLFGFHLMDYEAIPWLRTW